MNKTKRNFLISWMLLMVMLLLNFVPIGSVYADKIEKGVLTDLKAIITQGEETIPADGTLKSTEPIRVDVSFGIPVEGDSPTPANPVKKGDTVTIPISNAFTIPSGENIELKAGEILVGHVSFERDSDKVVIANVVFDGAVEVFNGTYNGVTAKFWANFQYDDSGTSGDVGDHTITILEKTYTVKVPAVTIEYNVKKTGVVNPTGQSITWTVTLNGTRDAESIDLSEYQFFDELKNVGEYIPESFTVDGIKETPTVSGTALIYDFPTSSTSPQEVTFKTKITDEIYYENTEQTVSNTAQLRTSESSILTEGKFDVKFTPKWIEKAGKGSDDPIVGEYNSNNRTITWTIIANHNGATLNNVAITDALPTGLTHKSSKWETWDSGTDSWVDMKSITPSGTNNDLYELGNISSKILLTIVTSVPDESYTTGVTTYRNSASIKWDGLTGTGIGSGSFDVGIGYNAISKSGVVDTKNQKITWTVEVNPQGQNIPELKVYDLLVYGNSINLETVNGIPSGISSTALTPQFGHKYADNFTGSGTMKLIPVMQGTTRVADLLEITGLSPTEKNSFTFDSQVLNPNIFAGNETSKVYNTATLFSSNKKLNSAKAEVEYMNKMLQKEMLKREAIPNPVAGVNNSTTNASKGFDYVDKSAIFRLSVNADGIDLTNTTNAALETLGTATLTDVLPAGWEFVEIETGSEYLIFEGYKVSGGLAATGDALTMGSDFSSKFTPSDPITSIGGIVTFTFNTLDKPYVILVKAKPTSDTVERYFDSNKTTTARNNVSLNTENWTPGISKYQDVQIISEILGKTGTLEKDGELLWKLDYMPYDLKHIGSKLELKDELPLGLDLRMDSSGILILGDNIKVNEMTLNADGTYTIGNPIMLELGENVHYDNDNRALSFNIPDIVKAYRFSYITDITGEPGKITNKASLLGGDSGPVEIGEDYIISDKDGSASLKRNGWISIQKTDGYGDNLAGAEFTLFALDGTTVIKKGITGSDGIAKIKVIPDGEYILKETKAPSGFSPTGSVHSLVVITEGSTVTASIDGKTGVDSNKITLKNFEEGTTGKLIINKTVAGNAGDTTKKFDFTIVINNVTGTYTESYIYIGDGIPDGEIESGDTISLAHNQSITIVGLPKDATYEVTEANYSGHGYTTASTGATGNIVADKTQTASFTNTRNTSRPGTGNLTISKTVLGDGAEKTKPFSFKVTFNGATGTYNYTGNGVPSGKIKSGDTVSLANGQNITITGLPNGAKYTVLEGQSSAQGYSIKSVGSIGNISSSQDSTAAFTNTKDPVTTPGEDPPVDVDGDIPGGGDVVVPGGELPKTGGTSRTNIFFIGGLLILLGIMLRRTTA